MDPKDRRVYSYDTYRANVEKFHQEEITDGQRSPGS